MSTIRDIKPRKKCSTPTACTAGELFQVPHDATMMWAPFDEALVDLLGGAEQLDDDLGVSE